MVKDLLAGRRQVAVLYLHVRTRAKFSGSSRDRKMLKFVDVKCVYRETNVPSLKSASAYVAKRHPIGPPTLT